MTLIFHANKANFKFRNDSFIEFFRKLMSKLPLRTELGYFSQQLCFEKSPKINEQKLPETSRVSSWNCNFT